MSPSVLTHVCRVVLCFLVAALLTTAAQIQGMHSFVNRREGTNIHKDALQDFTLIGLHRNFRKFEPKSTLNVGFFLPQPNGNSERKIFVEATELRDSCHYFMTANISPQWKSGSWNIFGPWPTADVIDQLSLSADNIGVLAWYRDGGDPPVYLPVDVSANHDNLPLQPYRIHFITGRDLQSLDVSISNSSSAPVKVSVPVQKCNRALNPNCKIYAAGSSQSFPLDMSSLPSGEYHVKFLGHVPGSLTPTSLDVMLYHHK
jgi:hypothetical protein